MSKRGPYVAVLGVFTCPIAIGQDLATDAVCQWIDRWTFDLLSGLICSRTGRKAGVYSQELCMVQSIEELSPELNGHALSGQPEVSVKREIDVVNTWRSD